jgi:hypothetical protein
MNDKRRSRSRRRFYQLTEFEKVLLGQIFKAILQSGKAPSVTVLHKALKTYRLRIVRTYGKLEQKRRLVRKKETGEIVCVYPLSFVPTEHQVVIEEGTKLYANSALDALGIPHLFNRNAEITSPCRMCTEAITITIKNGDIVSKSHPHVYVWKPLQAEIPAASTYSRFIGFFCSEKDIDAWMRENPQQALTGHSRLLEQEYPCIKEYWVRYGRMVGIR